VGTYAEGKHGLFTNELLTIGEKYGKSVAQVVLRLMCQDVSDRCESGDL